MSSHAEKLVAEMAVWEELKNIGLSIKEMFKACDQASYTETKCAIWMTILDHPKRTEGDVYSIIGQAYTGTAPRKRAVEIILADPEMKARYYNFLINWAFSDVPALIEEVLGSDQPNWKHVATIATKSEAHRERAVALLQKLEFNRVEFVQFVHNLDDIYYQSFVAEVVFHGPGAKQYSLEELRKMGRAYPTDLFLRKLLRHPDSTDQDAVFILTGTNFAEPDLRAMARKVIMESPNTHTSCLRNIAYNGPATDARLAISKLLRESPDKGVLRTVLDCQSASPAQILQAAQKLFRLDELDKSDFDLIVKKAPTLKEQITADPRYAKMGLFAQLGR